MNMTLKSKSVERRRTYREDMHLDGRIVMRAGQTSVPCLVADWSEMGARLVVDRPAALPETFVLMVERPGWRVDATVCWRKADSVGVAFSGVSAAQVLQSDETAASETRSAVV